MIQLNKIYNENCLEGMLRIPDNFVDSIICDLPYGTTACSWDEIIPFDELWTQYRRVIKPNGAIVLFGAEPFSTKLRMSNFKEYRYDWYWVKNNVTGFTFAKSQPMRKVETISVFSKGTANYYPQGLEPVRQLKGKVRHEYEESIVDSASLSNKEYFQEFTGFPSNVLRFDREAKWNFHPTQKPVDLLEYLVKTYTREGEVVLDNCMGSGTTAIACLNTDRQFIGFEMNKKYYDQSLDRIKYNQTQLSLF
ncbi:DNA modification methylase [Enterococcus sp. PF1-24]|uniref:DNA-methyltransferase n=1 Tax=unclassified Enterococcus TaxID=2608891 RepID=UPI0024759320|nr:MULTISPECIES: site-specific DNA-methyltransferase [unclassified Enterococcus]MDH6364534.1 DNA modification methylase [Enterococcus sp. PFB1-1]MDH6401589.1 DNA modification methylase [Enterococcus sp. PF1-24]